MKDANGLVPIGLDDGIIVFSDAAMLENSGNLRHVQLQLTLSFPT